jgi:ABC-type polar amino acid transport system ATPase subunit
MAPAARRLDSREPLHVIMHIPMCAYTLERPTADQVLFMDGGVIVERGTPDQVLTRPRTERARQFLHRIIDPLE